MASTTLSLKDEAETAIVYSLVGQTPDAAVYRNVNRSLALPQSLDFKFKLGSPGAKGNDKITVTLRDTVQNSTTGVVSTATLAINVSIPRDDAWTEQMTQDLLIQVQDLLSDANSISLADGITP